MLSNGILMVIELRKLVLVLVYVKTVFELENRNQGEDSLQLSGTGFRSRNLVAMG